MFLTDIYIESKYKKNMKHRVRLAESDLHRIVRESVKKIIRESGQDRYNSVNDEWYNEEDYDGNVGEKGMVRSYNIGTYYESQAEEDAHENGYDNLEDYLRFWWSEVQPECPWYWTKIGSGYGYHGTTIFRDGQTVCKEIYGQIMFDEYPI